MEQDNILTMHKVTKIYSGTVALDNIDINIKKGEVHGIIGKNGAGKSTLVNIFAGVTEPTAGKITINGKVYSGLSRQVAKNEGIAIVPQEPQVVLDYTVAENLFMPNYVRHEKFKIIDWPNMYAAAKEIIQANNLSINAEAKASDLTISEQQLLLVIKACYVDNSQIIILDEASASLSQKDEKVFYDMIQKMKEAGRTIIFISHRVDEILKLCDRVTVIRDGRTIATVSCDELDKEKISRLIVGEELKGNDYQLNDEINGEIVLKVEGLTKYGVFKKISFCLRKGEVLGFAGLRGSGRTEIFKSIIGVDSFDEGSIIAGNVNGRFRSPSEAFQNGVVYLPEDREYEGLISVLSVRENLVLNSLDKIRRGFFLSKEKEQNHVSDLIKLLDVKTTSPEQEIGQLSGGNKQKVVVGRILASEPTVFILDEPTRGIDIAAKAGILQLIQRELRKTSGIIITSPGLEDLIQVCDRILVLHEGQIIKEVSRESFDEGELYYAMQGA